MTHVLHAPASGSRWTRRSTVALLTVLVLFLGLAATAWLAEVMHRSGHDQVRAQSTQTTQQQADAMAGVVQEYTQGVQALAAAAASYPVITDRDFQALSSTLERLPGVGAITYLQPVPSDPAAVAAAQRAAREQLGTAITFAPAPLEAPAVGHLFVLSSRTPGTSVALTGQDLAQLAPVREAATTARASGSVAVTRPYVLFVDRGLPAEEQQQSVLLVAPVVAGQGQPDQGAFRGWVTAAFRLQTVAYATSAGSTRGGVLLSDVTDAAAPVPLARVTPRAEVAADLGTDQTITVGARRWRVATTPEVGPAERVVLDRPGRVLVSGACVALLLAWLTFAIVDGRRRAQREVERSTASLAAEVAARRRGEEALRTRESELSAYTTVVADRLRLPLARVEDIAASARQLATDPRVVQRLDVLEVQVDRAERLVDDLLLYARAGQLALVERAVDLRTVVTALCDREEALALGQDLPPALRPRFTVDPLPEVVSSPELLQHVLERLLDNAVRHAPPGQAPVVHVTSDLTGASFRGEEWRIEVRDQGLGIAPERRARIFEPFAGELSDVALPTNHLGLAICRRLVLRLGGEVGVDAAPGGGSVFWFTVPVRTVADSLREMAPAPALQGASR